MLRAMCYAVPIAILVAAGLPAADEKPEPKDAVNGVVVKVDARDHKVVLRMKDAEGKEVEKTFSLGDGLLVTDDAGKASSLESVQPGDAVVAVIKEGRLAELRRGRREEGRQERREERREERQEDRPFDVDHFMERHDKNKDGFIERDEMPQRFRWAFDQLDTNKDGKLSREELEKGSALLHRERRPADLIDVLIENSDCDEDCAKELQIIYDALRQMDKDRSGKIDLAELKAAREKIIDARVNEILEDQDANNDGKISRDEARGVLKRDFDKLDLNKDGFLDRDELRKAASEAPAAGKAPGERKPPDR